MRTPVKLTPKVILYQLLTEIPKNDPDNPHDNYVFVILGPVGPTGKTWLRDKLNSEGYTAYELAPATYKFIEFNDKKNHYVVDHLDKLVTVILNERL